MASQTSSQQLVQPKSWGRYIEMKSCCFCKLFFRTKCLDHIFIEVYLPRSLLNESFGSDKACCLLPFFGINHFDHKPLIIISPPPPSINPSTY